MKGFRKLKLREVNKLAWGHTALTWKREESNHGLSNLGGLTGRRQNTLTVSLLSRTLNHSPGRPSMTGSLTSPDLHMPLPSLFSLTLTTQM